MRDWHGRSVTKLKTAISLLCRLRRVAVSAKAQGAKVGSFVAKRALDFGPDVPAGR